MEVSPNWEGTGKINFLREDLPMKKRAQAAHVLSSLSFTGPEGSIWQVPETGHGPHRRSFR
eukprot:scaffold14591_cov140-Isochrysis_galbana.AAC.10